MITKLVSKLKEAVCPRCGKPALFKRYDNGKCFYEHVRKGSGIKMLGQEVMDVAGCDFTKEELKKALEHKIEILDGEKNRLQNKMYAFLETPEFKDYAKYEERNTELWNETREFSQQLKKLD